MPNLFSAPKPGYGLEPRAATLPVSGIYGGPLDYVSRAVKVNG